VVILSNLNDNADVQRYVGATAAFLAALFFAWVAARANDDPIARATVRMSRGGRAGAVGAAVLFLLVAVIGFFMR
jgi:F0F1-type ATP synthase assembly protein I